MTGVDGLRIDEAPDGRFEVRCHVPAPRLGEVTGLLHAAGIHTLTATPPSLDDLFLSAYSGAGAATGGEERTGAGGGEATGAGDDDRSGGRR